MMIERFFQDAYAEAQFYSQLGFGDVAVFRISASISNSQLRY